MKKTYFIALIIIVITLLGANIFFLLNHNVCGCRQKQKIEEKNVNCNCYVTKTLALDKEQAKEYEKIKKEHQNKASKITDSLHINQEILMDYLASNKNDSVKIVELKNKITEFQKELLDQHIGQYEDLKAILKHEQIEPMNKLFKSVFVCRPSCNHSKACEVDE